MPTAYLNIGSNIGNRRSTLERAVACIKQRWFPVRVSTIVDSAPWGYDSPNRFLNIGVAFDIPASYTPLQLFDELQSIQNSISPSPHRSAGGAYIDRAIDIDLIAIDTLMLNTPRLQLPHPRMHLRDFVLKPMDELAPSWIHPRFNLTPAQLLEIIAK